MRAKSKRHIWKTQAIGYPYPERCTQDVCAYCGLTRRSTTGGYLLSIPILAARGNFFMRTLPPCPSYLRDFAGQKTTLEESTVQL